MIRVVTGPFFSTLMFIVGSWDGRKWGGFFVGAISIAMQAAGLPLGLMGLLRSPWRMNSPPQDSFA
ncbi:hypothetical protein FQZ97_444510 [compost metagenome]